MSVKFRNPETGEVFEVEPYCGMYDFCNGECLECPLFKKADTYCSVWINRHPHEAAKLMGYEVMEDSVR